MRKYLSIVGTAVVAAAVLAPGAARADIVPATSAPVSVVANGNGTFSYNYLVNVTATQEVRPGDFFTFYDFNGFTGAVSYTPSAQAQLLGFTAASFTPSVTTVTGTVVGDFNQVTPFEDGAPNVTFTYNAPANGPVLRGGAATNMSVPIGTFTLVSTLPVAGVFESFVGGGTDQDTGFQNVNGTNYLAPVPEPGEYAVAGIFAAGLVGLMVRARRRTAREGGMAQA